MGTTRVTRAGTLGIALTLTFGAGTAAAKPSDGYMDHQDYANVSMMKWLDGCIWTDVWGALVAGDILKNPIAGGAPGPWSDFTIIVRLHDDCAGTTTELNGFVVAPPDIVRLDSASVDHIVVPLTDASGNLEVDVTATIDWTVAGATTSVRDSDLGDTYFRQERNAPAAVVGSLDVSDPDGDVWPGGFGLTETDAHDANIGVANEIALGES